MLPGTDRTVIFLDVDGTVIPFGGAVPRGAGAGSGAGDGNPLLERLDPALGPRLPALGCELVWATTWMAQANEEIAPRLGLPVLPLVTWSEAADDPPVGLHWKTEDLVGWAAAGGLSGSTTRSAPPTRHGRRPTIPRPHCCTASTHVSA